MRTGAWLFLGLLFLSACAGPRPLKWSVSFPGGTPTPSTVSMVHAEVRTSSTCAPNDPGALVFWDVPADHSAPFGMGQDRHLAAGTYYLYVEARDSTCTPVFTGCQMVTFPTDAQQVVPLTAVTGQPASCATMCSNGRCTGMMLPDLGMDAGMPPTDMPMDVPGSEGGTCNGCMMAGSCQPGVAPAACGSGGMGCSMCSVGTTECLLGSCAMRTTHFAMSAVSNFLMKPNGHIYSCGGDAQMQRGNFTASTPDHSFDPMSDMPGNGTAYQLASSQFSTYAIDSSGLLWAWGSNVYGLLGGAGSGGPGSNVVGGAHWASISAGDQHVCGIQVNGSLWCWGNGANGRVGTGGTGPVSAPTRVNTSTTSTDTWLTVSAGYAHTCAVRSDRTLWCWGGNDKGQLGNGMVDATGATTMPIPVGTDTGWTAVAAAIGGSFTCGIRSGHLYCWGQNESGELGNGAMTDSPSPVEELNMADNWTAVSSGHYHSCGLQGTTLLCWGNNFYGSIGDGNMATQQLSPKIIAAGTTWATVTAGWDWTCGTRIDGTAYCWGRNMGGVLGIGMDPATVTQETTPTAISAP